MQHLPFPDASSFISLFSCLFLFHHLTGRTRNHGHYVCSTWGNNHFKTFDGDIYQFPGICEYNFASDCQESYKEFSVHIQRALNSNNHPEIQYILITIKDFTVYLRPKLAVVDGRIVKTPYYSSGVFIESNDIYTKVYAKLGLILIWNQQDALMVELDSKFNNHTCGLCGDYNGVPIYNEFINGVTSYNSITYGNLQKISKPNTKCEDPDETQALPSCNGHRNECERLLTSSAFADCWLRLNLEMYIQACMQDKCACNGNEDSFCLCSTISEYSRQCSHAGGRPGEWRTQYFCPKTCPDTMIYRESSSPCMDTCSHLEISSLCEEHYMDGCFCPEGTVYDDITEKGCILASQCYCKLHGKEYSPGERSWLFIHLSLNDCRWTCKDLPCPGTCSVEGGSHITTFDGKKYTFHGDCYYVLAKGTVNDSHALLAELSPCGSTDRQTCLKTVVLLVDHKKNVVVFRSDGSVLLNEMTVNVPHVSASFSVFKPSSYYLVAQTSFGLQLQIQLFPVMQLFVTVDQSVQGKLQGLCGNFNGMEGDDFKTTSGLVEATGSAFANTWKAQSTCTDQVEKLEDPCSLSTESANYAEHWCSLLKNSEGPFARCHLIIDPSEYYKKCKYDTCLCEDNEECLCAALSSYSRACAFKGIILGGWRKNICSKYEVSACPGNQIFLYNLTMCQQTCRSLADGEKHCLQDFPPMDGCGCPYNTYLDNQDTCVPISKCPCYYKGSYLEPGEYVTKDGERWYVLLWLVCGDKKCSSNKMYFDCNASPKWTSQTPLQLSCHTPRTDHAECVSGCVCPEGLFDDGKGGCVEEKDCPCIHNNQWYSPGQKITVDCNTCTCQKGLWSCTEDVCYGTCMIYGSGHYITFDGKFYDFDGSCEYVATQDFCGDKNSSSSFSIITENVPCGTTGVTCSKAIKMFLGKTELKLENKDYKEIQRDIGDDVRYWNRTVGLYLVIEASNGVMLIWDKKTTIFIKLTPDYKGKVCGLCGNFDDKSNNDFTTRSGLQETNALKFGNSWKQSSMCPDITQEIKPCDVKPHRKSWAEKECSIIRSEVFKICHSKVDPIPFYEACVHDACSCDSGGDCECFCSAVAAYAQECTKAQACVFWRTPDICPIFCDYYNPRNECDWHYEPCGSNVTTCRMINNVSTNFSVPYLEGCYPRCPKDKPVYNEETKECVPEDQCWCYINGTHVPPGSEIPTEENCTKWYKKCENICSNSGKNLCIYEVGEIVAQIQDGNICITYVCAENGSIVVGSTYPCPTSTSPTTISTSFPTSTLTTTGKSSTDMSPCFGFICNWTQWFDVSKPEEDGGDYETYDAIRNEHGNKICEAPEDIECRAKDNPDMSLEELGQKVECNVTYGLICKNEEQDATMWQLCYNYEIRVNCCEWSEISCETTSTLSPTPTATSTTTSTTVPITTTVRQSTAVTTMPIPTPTITSEFTPSVTTPVTSTSPGIYTTVSPPPVSTSPVTVSTSGVTETGSTTRTTTSGPTPSGPTPHSTTTVMETTSHETSTTGTGSPPTGPPSSTTSTTTSGPSSPMSTASTTVSPPPVSTSPVTVSTSGVTETGSTTRTTTSGPTPSRPTPHSTTTVTETTSHETSTTGTGSPPTGPPSSTTSTTTSGPSSPMSTASTTVSPPPVSTSPVTVSTSGVTETGSTTRTTTSGPTPSRPTPHSTTTVMETTSHETSTTGTGSPPTGPPSSTTSTTTSGPSSPMSTASTTVSPPPVSTSPVTVSTSGVTETGSTTRTTTSGPTPSRPTPHSTTTVAETTSHETSTTGTGSPPTGPPSSTTSTTTSGPSSPMSTASTTVSPPPVSTSPVTVSTSGVTETGSTTRTTTSGPTPSRPTPHSTTTVTETTSHETSTTGTGSPPTGPPSSTTSTTTSGPSSPMSTASTTVSPPPVSTSPVTVSTSGVTETGSTTKTTTSGPTPSGPTPHSTTTVTETGSPMTTTATRTTPTRSTAITTTMTSGPSSIESASITTVSPPSVSTSITPVTTSGTTPTESFTTTSGTTSRNFTSITATTTTSTSEFFSPGSTSTSGPTATSSSVTITGSSTYISLYLPPPPPAPPHFQTQPGESWWICDCIKAICIEDNIIQVVPVICNPPPKPTCANGLSPVQVIDEDGCCWHWECDCYCTGWGDPHYMTFDGLYYSYQGNCTYVLVEEIYKKVDNFGVYIDNYHCDTRDVVSCPRTLIVRHETQEVRMATVKPNTLQVEVTVNKQAVALPYKKFGLSIYESGINRVVEIPELKMNVTYNGLSFSIRMPYSLFGNNTHGQCGTCNNNTADDCMLPNGNIAENCETMADHWQVVDPSKPQCSPGLIPTKAPSTTPTQPCKESSICELLLGSLFEPCHGFVQPEKYYAACVFDSCVLPNLDLECSSLQTYAATCADQSVCIDWRSHTNGVCSYKCPSDKEYRACGPIKEITCKSSQQNETSTKQVEGCFCPNGTMLYDSGVDVCVKTCGCVGVDKIPREFGEKFTVDCQDCICLEGGNGIVCEPHECAKQNKTRCDGEGFYEVNEVNSEDSCCPIVTCKCNTSLCTSKAPKCTLGFEVHSHIPSGQCCPVYQCVFVDKCQNCFCTNEVNVSTQLNIISCEHIPCNTYCEPVSDKLKTNKKNPQNTHVCEKQFPGEFKNDPYNNCTIYSCVNIHNQLISSTSEITCPAFNEESCKPGTITFLPNGCCRTCNSVPNFTLSSVCWLLAQSNVAIFHVNRYSAEANSMDHSCSCCRESRTTVREVELKCPTGHSVSHKYIYVESCSCQDTECSKTSRSALDLILAGLLCMLELS
uniref:Mucin 2, oligomeric mucus/gel-forming n=1 Tax=Aquila chrysaetos chrysaetos TaxID=223781 RepID=A0A663EVC6_AQUCH